MAKFQLSPLDSTVLTMLAAAAPAGLTTKAMAKTLGKLTATVDDRMDQLVSRCLVTLDAEDRYCITEVGRRLVAAQGGARGQ